MEEADGSFAKEGYQEKERGERKRGEEDTERTKMHSAHISTPREEHNHSVLETCTNEYSCANSVCHEHDQVKS